MSKLSVFLATGPARVAAAMLLAIVGAALLAPIIAPQNPYDLAQIDILDGRLAPGSRSADGAITYWLGTDNQGRDMLSAILYGLRTSLLVASVSAAAALAIGTLAGLLSAYVGGKLDDLLMRLVDFQLSLPTILVGLILIALLGKGLDKVILALVVVQWAYYARTVRATALAEMRREYIEAAVCLALPARRILLHHLLPNCLPALSIVATVQVANSIALEATLSFLGLGVPITQPSLGLLISNGFEFLLSGRYWISTFPGLALVLLVLSLNLIGDRMRNLLNPRLQK